MNANNLTCQQCLIKSRAATALSADELGILETGCSQLGFRKGELIFKENGPARHVVYIRDGFVKLCKKGLDDKEFVLSVSKAGAYLGIQNLNKESKVNYFSAYALVDTQLCFLDISYFNRLLHQNGTFASEVIACIFNDEMEHFDRLFSNQRQKVPGRLADVLLYFSRQVYGSKRFQLNLSKTELASLIGTSREAASRMLSEFQNDGLIRVDKDEFVILDESRLEELKMKG